VHSDVLMNARTVRTTLGGVTGMTLHRWMRAGILPQPIKINGRNYWRESDVEALKQGRGRNSGEAAA
jgi:predicted site-specific integrase-resolvase